MSFVVSWDGPSEQEPDRGFEVTVTTIAELDAVLDRVAAQAVTDGLAYAVQIFQPDQRNAVMLGVGHPDRSFLDWLDRSQPHGSEDRIGVDPNTPPATDDIPFDVYGDWSELSPERTRITVPTAYQAAREYVSTGQRPTSVSWT
jgi:Immunity protein Imm1